MPKLKPLTDRDWSQELETFCGKKLEKVSKSKIMSPPGGLESPTFRLTAECAIQLRHGGLMNIMCLSKFNLI